MATLPTLNTSGEDVFDREIPAFYNKTNPKARTGANAVIVQSFVWDVGQALSTSVETPKGNSTKGIKISRLADVHSPLMLHVSATGTLLEQVVLVVARTPLALKVPTKHFFHDVDLNRNRGHADSFTIYTFSGVRITAVDHSFDNNNDILEHLHLRYDQVQLEWSTSSGEKDGTVVAIKHWNGTGAPPDPQKVQIFDHERARVKVGFNTQSKIPCEGSAYLPNKPDDWKSAISLWLNGHE